MGASNSQVGYRPTWPSQESIFQPKLCYKICSIMTVVSEKGVKKCTRPVSRSTLARNVVCLLNKVASKGRKLEKVRPLLICNRGVFDNRSGFIFPFLEVLLLY